MYKRIIIIGYNPYSNSVRALAKKLKEELNNKPKVLRVRKDSTTYKYKQTHYVIHWGVQNAISTNKLDCFRLFAKYNSDHENYKPMFQINYPEWTTDKLQAQHWLDIDPNLTVVGRKLLNSHSGKGIVLYNQCIIEDNCPLYVKYKKKSAEYRVHVFKGKVIDVAQKKKRAGAEDVNTKIRNHQNGWVYCRENITEPDDLRTQALNAADATGLKFGAVDIIYNKLENKCYVLEINTAPGITGTTTQKYVNAFIEDMKNEV